MRVFELQGVGRLHTKLEVSRARGFSKFVGRDRDIAVLDDALERALQGNGQVVGIIADPGVGKSRLCFEFVEKCRARGIFVLEGHCPSHGKTVPYLPILEIWRSHFGITEQDESAEARRKVAGTLLLLDEGFRDLLPLVFEFLGVSDPQNPPARMDPEAKQRQLLGYLRRLTHALSAEQPFVVLIDDLHWIDRASEPFVAEFAEAVQARRALFLVNFRPEYPGAEWMKRAYYHQLPLLPLGPEATGELLDDLLGKDGAFSTLRELIRSRTGGNPFFVEELVLSLAEAGALEGNKGSYRQIRSVEGMEIPATVQVVLAARLDRLGEREKELLQAASVIGKTFPGPILRKVSRISEMDLAAALSVLRQAEFLYDEAVYPEATHAFKHPLTQEVTYRSQLTERRRVTHAEVARALEEHCADKLDERAAELAYHWEGAGEPLEAARWHARAADWAGVRDARVALLHWTKVRDLLGSTPETPENMTLGVLACSRMLQLGWRLGAPEEEIAGVFREGTDLATRAGDRRSLAVLLSGYGAAKGCLAGEIGEYVEHGTRAVRVAEETSDTGLILGVQSQLCYGLLLAGRFRELRATLEVGFASRPRDLRLGNDVVGYCPYIQLFSFQGGLDNLTGRLGEAAKTLDAGIALAREHSDLETLSAALGYRSEGDQVRGDQEAAFEHGRQGLEIAEKTGSAFWRSFAHVHLARAYLVRREWGEAVDRLEEILKTARERRTGIEQEPFMLAGLAEAYLGRGDATAARRAAEEAVRVAERGGMRFFGAVAELALARVLLRADGASAVEAVRQALDRALARIEETGGITYEPFVRLELAELARLTGDAPRCQRELREAHRLFLEIGAPIHAERLAKELRS